MSRACHSQLRKALSVVFRPLATSCHDERSRTVPKDLDDMHIVIGVVTNDPADTPILERKRQSVRQLTALPHSANVRCIFSGLRRIEGSLEGSNDHLSNSCSRAVTG